MGSKQKYYNLTLYTLVKIIACEYGLTFKVVLVI